MTERPEPGPEFDGQCAFALSVGKKGVKGRPTIALQENGRRYLFSSVVARFLWRALPNRKDKADKVWAKR